METDRPPEPESEHESGRPPEPGSGHDPRAGLGAWRGGAAGEYAPGPPAPWVMEEPQPAAPQPVPPHSRRHMALAAGLFLLTVASTFVSGGAPYAGAIMIILLSHEMGHYVMCRRYGVRSTLPLFIPMPFISPFGTMGAVIFMNQTGQNRKALFDIGIAGPLAGMVPATIAVIWGLAHSTVAPATPASGMHLGGSILFSALMKVMRPGLGDNADLLLHPVAYAGWAGFFVTALNLLPVGQLDGGHVLYGLLGRRSVYVSLAVLAGLAVTAVFYPQWWFLVALLLFLIGPRHRRTADDSVPLGGRRVVLGILALAILVLCFTPQPFILH